MADHPIFGAILFVLGFILVTVSYGGLDPRALLLMGHVFAFNGALWLLLWCRKQEIATRRIQLEVQRL